MQMGMTDDFSRAWMDWLVALGNSPDKQAMLLNSASREWQDAWAFAIKAATGWPLAHDNPDRQFADAAWSQWPFNVYAHSHGNMVNWWNDALVLKDQLPTDRGMRLEFTARQMLAAASPANYLATNPELLRQTYDEKGDNLLRGIVNWFEDTQRMLDKTPARGAEKFSVGEVVAATPGKVVFRNELIELIQYSPQTPSVHAEPILIVPAWIMKYYILDLSPRNSLVRYLVEQGHTVFMMSWRNPDANDRDLGMDDYLRMGFEAAVDTVARIVPNQRIHGVGYCIGGTLLSIGAAELAARGDTRIGSVTMFAAQTDFSEPGELSVFITPSQLDSLNKMMDQAGVLTSEQMGMSFALLRSADLLWGPAVNTYLRGKREEPNDLMAWNADGTRMPYRMHSEYLGRLYLNNDLANNRFPVNGKPVSLSNITVPMFVVGTETDHVAPWRSAYKTRALTESDDYTFLLTSGGHNAGIISGPSHPKRTHRVVTSHSRGDKLSPDAFMQQAEQRAGSWWPTWEQWLTDHSPAPMVAPPKMGLPNAGTTELGFQDAPGGYVLG